MKKLLVVVALAILAGQALADTAIWTGRMEYVTTVTYKQALKCWYHLGTRGTYHTMLFVGGTQCPNTIEIE